MAEEEVQKKSKFMQWYESDTGKKTVNIIYCLGASVVIIGALFKILHWPGASYVLTAGMFTESFLFAIGSLDKPHVEYKWDNLFPALVGEKAAPLTSIGGSNMGNIPATGYSPASAQGAVVPNIANSGIADEDMKKLSDGIKNLTDTANQLASLSSVVDSTDKFAKTMNLASEATSKFTNAQESLNTASQGLGNSYQTIAGDMDSVVKQTKQYTEKMETVNTHLASINSVYELQLKNIQAQTEKFGEQNEKIGILSSHINNICDEVNKIQQSAVVSAEEAEKYKAGNIKLAQQIADLNKVYGNMLNALN